MRVQIRIRSRDRIRCAKRCPGRQCISCGIGNTAGTKERRLFASPNIVLCNRIAEREAVLFEKEQAINNLQSAIGRLESFTYSAAHDLRAPLRAIDGFSAMLERDSADDLNAGARAKLRCIRDGVRRMQSLIDDLLDLSRCDSAELRRGPVDLTELANAVVENLRQAEPARQVEFAVAERLVVDGDRRLLLILLENILGNAWKYTSKRDVAHIEFRYEAGRSAFSVHDNGAGFDVSYAEKLFRPFQRLHSTAQFEGNGIGLCIVRRIVERHGGRVWIESAVDRGTTVHFTLSETAVAGASGELGGEKTARKIRVLDRC